jgi:shikimate 5-dehydrogenase
MPLKAEIIPHLDGVTPESELTGAVNTVVKVREEGKAGFKLIGTNTDFIGRSSASPED